MHLFMKIMAYTNSMMGSTFSWQESGLTSDARMQGWFVASVPCVFLPRLASPRLDSTSKSE